MVYAVKMDKYLNIEYNGVDKNILDEFQTCKIRNFWAPDSFGIK